MQIGVIGINHKLADLSLRERFAKACQKRFGSCFFNQNEQCSFVLLSTCNRTEVYFCSHDLTQTHAYFLNIIREEIDRDFDFDQKLYSYFGGDCFLHLVRVTAGLDSAILAETEIQGQVKVAYESASINPSLPEDLHYLFQKALKIGKQVRTELSIGRGMPEIEHAVFSIGHHFFNENLKKSKVLFIGASEINFKILQFLKQKNVSNLTLCNRSLDHAKGIANEYKMNLLNWHHIDKWHEFDWVIFGTKSPDFLITHEHVPKSHISHKLIFDLCVPRNVEPKIGKHPHITLMNIDQINRTLNIRKQRLNESILKAESFIGASCKMHHELFQRKTLKREHLIVNV